MKEKRFLTFSTSLISTLLIVINIMSIYYIFVYNDIFVKFPNKYYAIPLFVGIWSINYFAIVRQETFLQLNFKKDLFGGYIIIGIIILTLLLLICVGNIYRSTILV
jgi:hypothetical protein